MKCDHCGRAVVYEQFYGGQEHFWGWRCIFCGEIIDDVIIENRQWVKKGVESARKKLDLRLQEGNGIPRY